MTRGPLADEALRLDFLALDKYLKEGGGRKAHRDEVKKQSKKDREHELGTTTAVAAAGGGRGLSLGPSSQRDVALIAQQQAKLANQSFESNVVKHDILLKTIQGQVDFHFRAAEMYKGVDSMAHKFKEHMEAAEALLQEITSCKDELRQLQNPHGKSIEVEEYLKRSRLAMNIECSSNKKRKQSVDDASASSSSSSSNTGMLRDE